ncbi:MAG: hypothetical protein JNK30_21060 [Phenylobacterium sp.]|uniref:hypothetical protein n=1 Tax=Phenylobacterium sp. TaxID=1871053 RepID=UPI001A52C769|nr:hypothetical protein [Phenylobacterium sp.]MBL8773890.1 hypothetical protein [Phenylobacterium sp.]
MTVDDDEVEYRLRDLPGVMEVEKLLIAAEASRSGKWSREFEEAQKLADKVSRRHFGIGEKETRYVDDDRLSRIENDWLGGSWDPCFQLYEFENLPAPWAPWSKLGWDVKGSDGRQLRALELFWRQLVAVGYGLAGRYPDEDDGDLTESEKEAIAAKLAADRDRFKPSR